MRFHWIVILLLFSACDHSPQPSVVDIKSLGLQSVDNGIETFYSNGFREKAVSAAEPIHNSADFFEESFGVRESISVAILNKEDWTRLTPIPYGLPFVSGPPYVICIPATADNILSQALGSALQQSSLEDRYQLSNDEITERFILMIGFHELGHIYARSYGMQFPNKWTFELAATYFAYFYLAHNAASELELWLETAATLGKNIEPTFTTIEDFEKLYTKVGVGNYAWYQVVFLYRVREIYEQQGKQFLEALKNHNWTSSSSHHLLEMEQLSPGFQEWADRYYLLR